MGNRMLYEFGYQIPLSEYQGDGSIIDHGYASWYFYDPTTKTYDVDSIVSGDEDLDLWLTNNYDMLEDGNTIKWRGQNVILEDGSYTIEPRVWEDPFSDHTEQRHRMGHCPRKCPHRRLVTMERPLCEIRK